MLDEYFARDIMKSPVVTVDSASTVIDAAKMMSKKGIGCVIITDGGVPVGIITERDIVSKVAAREMPVTTGVKDVMSFPLISVGPDETIWEMAEKMKLNNVHKMPVMLEKKVLGIVTTSDITRLCSIGSDSEMRMVCQQILQRLNQP